MDTIEKAVLDYLSEHLDGVDVGMEVPKQLSNYVLIEKTGSSWANHITTATIAVQSYGSSMYEALVLNERVKEAMKGLVELPAVSGIRLETDYNYTNTATKQYRYQAVFQITHYLGGF